MSDNKYNPEYYYLDSIYISNIVFDETENLTIFGCLYDEEIGILKEWDFFCAFNFLTDILLFADYEGDVLIKLLSEKLSEDFDIPSIIDVEELFGKPLLVENLILKVYIPQEEDEYGDLVPMKGNYLYIESVESKEKFLIEQPEKYIAKLKDGKLIGDPLDEAFHDKFGSSELDPKKLLDEYLLVLDNAFKYYSLLKRKDFKEKDARKRAGLSDELLFRIALYNNMVIKNK